MKHVNITTRQSNFTWLPLTALCPSLLNRPRDPAVSSEKLGDLSEDHPADERETRAHRAAFNTTPALLF